MKLLALSLLTVLGPGIVSAETTNQNPIATGLFDFRPGNVTHMQNFKRITEDVKDIEDRFRDCIKRIPWLDYTSDAVEECVGLEYSSVASEIDFERRKLISRGESQIRDVMLELCYKNSTSEVNLLGCDLMEKDALKLLWMDLNFHSTLQVNRVKYLFEHGKIEVETFDRIQALFEQLYSQIEELRNECDNHKKITIVRLKEYIDTRSKEIVNKANALSSKPAPKIRKQTIEVYEKVKNQNVFNLHLLPRPMLLNGSPEMTQFTSNPYLDEINKAQPDLIPAFDRAPLGVVSRNIEWNAKNSGLHSLRLSPRKAKHLV